MSDLEKQSSLDEAADTEGTSEPAYTKAIRKKQIKDLQKETVENFNV